MLNTNSRADKAAQEAARKARRKQEQAAIVGGLQTVLDKDEQLLAFLRGSIAGGFKGKLTLGPEAFFAPYVNVGLTDRRLILQHVHPENDKPSEIEPHFFPLADLVAVSFTDIETFGQEMAGRITLRLKDEQHIRVRLGGEENCEDAQAMAEVHRSLIMTRRRDEMSPTQSKCASCGHILDQPFKFCPYCGQRIQVVAEAAPSPEGPVTPAPTSAWESAAPTAEATSAPIIADMPAAESAATSVATSETAAAEPIAQTNDQRPTTNDHPTPDAQHPTPTPSGPAGAFGLSWSSPAPEPPATPPATEPGFSAPAPEAPVGGESSTAAPAFASETAATATAFTEPSFTSEAAISAPEPAVQEPAPPPVSAEFTGVMPPASTEEATELLLASPPHAESPMPDAQLPTPDPNPWPSFTYPVTPDTPTGPLQGEENAAPSPPTGDTATDTPRSTEDDDNAPPSQTPPPSAW